MKRSILIVWAVFLAGCCMSQLPTQYAYVDENCSAILPDFTGMVVVSDNCQVVNLTQIPLPGEPITATTQVKIVAIDNSGNESVMGFDVVLMDTTAPLMMMNPEWQGYTDKEIGTMYKAHYAWVQKMGDYYNANVAGRVDTMYIPEWDTTFIHTNDTMHIFYGTIPITDPEYRIDNGYWQDVTPDLTAWFK